VIVAWLEDKLGVSGVLVGGKVLVWETVLVWGLVGTCAPEKENHMNRCKHYEAYHIKTNRWLSPQWKHWCYID
jgi:hypothetical protein